MGGILSRGTDLRATFRQQALCTAKAVSSTAAENN